MASAFTLTLAYLGEECTAMAAGGALAAYITGNVASNLIGRLISAGVADHLGLAANFYFFAVFNTCGRGTGLCDATLYRPVSGRRRAFRAWRLDRHLQPTATRGVWHRLLHPIRVYRHFHLRKFRAGARTAIARADGPRARLLPFCLRSSPRHLRARPFRTFGRQPTFWASLALAGLGLPMLLLPSLLAVVTGLMLIGVGTFFAQAAATGFVARAATTDRGSASEICTPPRTFSAGWWAARCSDSYSIASAGAPLSLGLRSP